MPFALEGTTLRKGNVLTVTAPATGAVTVNTLADEPNAPTVSSTDTISASGSSTYGPYSVPKRFSISDNATVTQAADDRLSSSETDVLDSVTAGTAALSKALVLDANKAISGFYTTDGVGTAETITGMSVTETGNGAFHKTTFTFATVTIAIADATGVTGWLAAQLYTFPEGLLGFYGAVADLALTKSSAGLNDDWDGDVGLGTATNDATATPMDSTQIDLIPNTATPQAAAGVGTADCQSTDTEIGAVFDGTSTAKEVWLNFLFDDADQDIDGTPCNLIINGTISMCWFVVGDNT